MIEVRSDSGLWLPMVGLALDPPSARPFAFVSHAHTDHIASHRRLIVSEATADLLEARIPGERETIRMPFGETRDFGRVRATLLPAGHVLGSAQILIEAAEGTLLYTGDFKLRPGLASEPAGWARAETLVIETTYGRPQYIFPPAEEIADSFVRFCAETLAEGGVPVVLAYSLGKAQEAILLAARAGLPVMVHGAVERLCRIYRRHLPGFPETERYAAGRVEGRVLVCPPAAAASPMVLRIPRRRTVALTGWALDPGYRFRARCDLALPLSDHAGYDDLLRMVERVAPRRVLTVHGFAGEFAADLRSRGIEAWALGHDTQLDLPLTLPAPITARFFGRISG